MVEVLRALVAWLQAPATRGYRGPSLDSCAGSCCLPGVEIPALESLSEVRTLLSERPKERTEQWNQDGLQEDYNKGVNANLGWS